mgnify:CR=1 FL=1
MTDRRVVVLGGGISGLAAAEAIERRARASGRPVRALVLEADTEPGGKIKTRTEKGFVVETGPHGFLDKEPKMFALIDRLGITGELVAANTDAARRFIYRAGALREVPMSPPAFLFSDILPLSGRLRCALEPFMPGPTKDEESVREFAARRIGPQAADVMVDAMVTGIYGGDPSKLSLKAAFPRMFELERDHGSLVKAQFAVAREKKAQRKLAGPNGHVPKQQGTGAPAGTLHSFRRGLGTLIEALAGRVDPRCGARVDRVEPGEAKRWRVRASLDDTTEWIEADAVVSTLPAYDAAALVRPLAPERAAVIDTIPYVPCSVVVQCFRQEDVTRSVDGFGFLVPGREDRSVLGTIWASTVFPDHAPSGQVMFRSMLGGARRAELGDASEAELAALARADLERLMGVKAGAEPTLETVIPWREAIPQYNLGHADRVAAAEAIEAEHPGLYLSGNAFRGVAVLACVAEADRVGEAVLKGLPEVAPAEAPEAPAPSPA